MAGLEPGDLFAGRYKILRALGAGGMGAVYLACDPLEEEFLVAIKVLNPGQAQNATARERFRNEITASYKINHPNVVRAYEYFDAEDIQAFAMEYVDGGDLVGRMNAGPPSVAESLMILIQAADALTAVHAAGIIHRDLKPENILLTRSGDVKIGDFGVARLKDAKTLTNAGSMVGTPKFLAPEYIEIGECDARGDIFALGVIGYELLSGVAPFGNETNPTKMLERFREPPTQLATLCPALPVGLAAVIMKAIETKVSKRYQSARELWEDLNAIKSGGVPKVLDQSPEDSKPVEITVEENPVTEPPKYVPSPESAIWSRPATYHSKREEVEKVNFLEPSIDEVAPTPSTPLPGPSIADEFAGMPPLEAFAQESSRSPKSAWTKFGVSALLCLLVVSIGVAYRSFAPALKHLPEGVYTGSAFGLFGDNSQTPLGIIRSAQGTVVILGRAGCAPTRIDESKGVFSCGDLKFDVEVEAITEQSAIGTISEVSWKTHGTWSVSKQ